tara:strand:- start:388 stop:675 length:288 start_codon:yes stop_codon:yes gene_type:complete
MKYVRIVRQTRRNVDIPFFTPTAETIAVMDRYVEDGKIESYTFDNISEDKLHKEMKMTFTNLLSLDEFLCEEQIIGSAAARSSHCDNYYISVTLE